MPGYQRHTISEGEDLPSIALQYKTSADKIWNDPKNVAIRQQKAEDWRKNLGSVPESPYVLEPGDTLWIPPYEPKKVAIATDQRHTFKRKGLRAKVTLYLQKDGKPRAGKKYAMKVEKETFSGVTGGDGKIEHWVPADAVTGFLQVEPDKLEPDDLKNPLVQLMLKQGGPPKEEYELHLGHIDPVTTDRGLCARLYNLGFLDSDDADADELEDALREFQEKFGIRVTGQPSAKTFAKLVELHRS